MTPPIAPLLEYLRTQRICALAVEMLDGSPHVATVHFAHTEEPLTFLIETSREYRKAEKVMKDGVTRASLCVGFVEGAVQAAQFDGILKEASAEAVQLYLQKFPEKADKAASPTTIFLQFDPSWWRFTNWAAPGGKKVWTSTDVA